MTTDTPHVSLIAKLAKSGGELAVHYTIHNDGGTPILVFNRLFKNASKPEADAQQVYRFVSNGTLKLLLGPAPLPTEPVMVAYVPEVTRLEPYATFEADISTPLPVTEYNVYFSKANPEERVAEQVHNVELFVTYGDAAGVKTMPSIIHPGALRKLSPVPGMRTIASGPIAMTLDALRQTGEYERFAPR